MTDMKYTETTKSEKISFWALLKKYNSIIIPIIQRDYAQGRNDDITKNIRKNFLTSLYDTLIEKDGRIVLDYVYGAIKDNSFLPVDGQQRLTTLFLLHRYLSWKEKERIPDYDQIQSRLSKFTYQVRDTATEFCELLAKNDDISLEPDKTPSDEIKNASWYHACYDTDQTVKAMLVMLDAIHKKFETCKTDLWPRLIAPDTITFWQLDLGTFSLDDDLYVKMNSRGKRLSPFDNFKNLFERELDKRVKMEKLAEESVNRWKNAIDNDWADFFYAKLKPQKNETGSFSFDMGEIENALYRFILLFFVSVSLKQDAQQPDSEQAKKRILYDDTISIADNNKLADTKCFNVESLTQTFLADSKNFDQLLDALDALTKQAASDWWQDVWEKLLPFLKGEAVFRDFAILYPLMRFLARFDKSEKGIKKDDICRFMRLCHHLVVAERGTGRNIELPRFRVVINYKNLGKILQGFDQLVEAVNDSDHILASLEYVETESLSGLSHEKTKAAFMLKSESNASLITALEERDDLQGQIYNFLSEDGQSLLLTAEEFDELLKCPKELLLRGLQCFSKDDLWISNGYCIPGKTAHYRKYFGFRSTEEKADDEDSGERGIPCGDLLWTSGGKMQGYQKQSRAAKGFLDEYGKTKTKKPDHTPEETVEEIIRNTLNRWEAEPDHPNARAYYLIKYPKAFLRLWSEDQEGCVFFITDDKNFTFLRLHDFVATKPETYKNFRQRQHYNPFYLALQQRLDELREEGKTNLKIVTELFGKSDPDLEQWIRLNDNTELHFDKTGNWHIKKLNEQEPRIEPFTNQDRIEAMAQYLISQ